MKHGSMLRLIDHLHAHGLDNRAAKRALAQGKIWLNGVPTADPGRQVAGYSVAYRPEAPRVLPGRDPYVLFSDGILAVVLKPAGMLSVASLGRGGEPDLIGWARRRFGRAYPVHRLDEETSGLMLVALCPEVQLSLKEALASHAIARGYMALVRHTFSSSPQRFDSVLVRNRGDGRRGSSDGDAPDGRRAITDVRLLQALSHDASWVEARLHTGRTHQVRIHLAEAGFAVLGDGLYGGAAIARGSPRLALHAWHLAFVHPQTGRAMTFEAPLADDLERLRRRLNPRATTTLRLRPSRDGARGIRR